MMISPFRLGLAIFALSVTSAGPAAACSVIGSYRAPGNLELVRRADTIVIGTVERAVPGPDNGVGEIIVHPTKLLKGARLPHEVRLRGFLSDGQATATRSDPRELVKPNPDTMAGSCTRAVFDQGMKLVLFLAKGRDGKLTLAGYPFARVAEDVPSDDAPWVKAVRTYVEVVRLPPRNRAAALRAKRAALSHRTGDPDARLLIEDIDRQIAVPRR